MASGRTATLEGRIVAIDQNGIQTVVTDSRIHPILKCAGPTYIQGGQPGDRVRLEYRIDPQIRSGMWFGRVLQ
jgi:acetamidase/formamidase